ncbi:MAG: nickel-dependent lactate racemase [Lentisphaerae bacterium]|nr:nickel-dependent lactate racemase [Lentisphaerota bacterium]
MMQVPAVLRSSAVCLGTLQANTNLQTLTRKDICASFEKPIWAVGQKKPLIGSMVSGNSVCIVVSDHTRKTASHLILPPLLEKIYSAGISERDVFFLIASGVHRHPDDKETALILGQDIVVRFGNRIFRHDPDDKANLTCVGKTKRGHDVYINRRAVEADHLILLGTVTYHYHAGFGGGRKSLVPGLADRDTIAHNHSLSIDPHADRIHPAATLGRLDGNPVSEEMLECAYMHEPDFIVNTVLAPDGNLVGVFFGELNAAHREACKMAAQVERCDIREQADIVLASAASAGDWVQSHKALYNAHRAVKNSGRILLYAPCREGIGSERLRYWVKQKTLDQIYRELRQSFEILGQTALSTKIRGAQTIIVTEMKEQDKKDLGLQTAPDMETAADMALAEISLNNCVKPTYYVIPQAQYVVPFISR